MAVSRRSGGAGLAEPRDSQLKRLADVLGAAFLLLVTSPILAVVAGLVRLTSAGPVFFLQERLGRNGVPFRVYKFRTMRAEAEAVLANDPVLHGKHLAGGHKIPDAEDPRITRIGRVLRRLSVDELPQLYNVLRGDMSLVGPRPIVPDETQRYDAFLDLMRLTRPGITGLWQISGEPHGDYVRREEIDREYVRTRSPRGDVVILLRTFGVVARAALTGLYPPLVRSHGTRADAVPSPMPVAGELGEGEQHLHGP